MDSSSKKTILIVDDDPDLVSGLTVRLRSEGYSVTAAGDCYGALAEAKRSQPDLMILDLGLPGGDGFVAMSRMNVNAHLWDLPIIVLSARSPHGNRKRAKELGAVAYFQKPADSVRLMEAIRTILEGEPLHA